MEQDEKIKNGKSLYARGQSLFTEGRYEEAFDCYMKAAELKNIDAITMVGYCYIVGAGVATNCNEGVKYSLLAATEGNSNAQNNVGWCYQNGFGVPANEKEALKWYELSASQGNSDGIGNLKILKKKRLDRICLWGIAMLLAIVGIFIFTLTVNSSSGEYSQADYMEYKYKDAVNKQFSLVLYPSGIARLKLISPPKSDIQEIAYEKAREGIDGTWRKGLFSRGNRALDYYDVTVGLEELYLPGDGYVYTKYNDMLRNNRSNAFKIE